MFEVFYRKVGEETWHKLTSNYPITYDQKPTPPQFTGGQCYQVWYEISIDYTALDPWGYVSDRTSSTDWYMGNPRAEYTLIRGPITGWRPMPWPPSHPYQNYLMDIEANFYTTGYGRVWGQMVFSWGTALRIWNPRNFRVRRKDGLIDNCGDPPSGECVTNFYSNGALIKTLSDEKCHEVMMNGNPADCDCCSSLIPIADRIYSRLS